MTSPTSILADQIASLQQQVNELRAQKVTYIRAPVVSVNSGASTFGAIIPNPIDSTGVTLSGISSPPAFLPHVGDTVTLALSGPHILFLPNGIGDQVITAVQIAPAAVGTNQLASGAVTNTILGSDVSGSIVSAQSAANTALTNAATAQTTANNAQSTATTANGVATTAQTTANGKNTVTWSTASPSGSGITSGDIWFQFASGVVAGAWQWNGSSWVVQTFGDSVLNTLTAAKITTGTLAAGVAITAGDPSGDHSMLDSAGFHVYQSTPSGVIEVGRLGTNANDFLGIGDSTGRLVAAVDQTGYGAFSGVSSTMWPDIGAPDWTGSGGNLNTILDRRPRGLVNYGANNTHNFTTNTTAGSGVFEVKGRLYLGRIYRIGVRCRINSTTSDCVAEVQVRWEQGGLNGSGGTLPTPSVTSAVAGRLQMAVPNGNAQGVAFDKPFSWGAGNGSDYYDARFLLCFSRPIGTGTLTMWGDAPDGIEMWIEDIGPYVGNGAGLNNGGGGTVAPPPQQYNTTWTATWTKSWKGDGSWMSNDGGNAYQGYDPSGFNGVQTSYIGFPDMTGTLAGATILDCGVFLFADHWYYNAGGTALLGAHGFLNAPASYGAGQLQWADSPNWPVAAGRWVEFPASQNWVSGTWRGIMLGDPGIGTNETYYGYFEGAGKSHPPQINITYTK